jgi:Leucine-rich repeat (LRR) protein
MKNTDFENWLNEELSDEDAENFNAEVMNSLQAFQLKEQFKQRLEARRLRRGYIKTGLITLSVAAFLGFIGFRLWQRQAESPVSTQTDLSKIDEKTKQKFDEITAFSRDSINRKFGKENTADMKNLPKNADNSPVSQEKNDDLQAQDNFSAPNNTAKVHDKNEKTASIDSNYRKTSPVDLPPISRKKSDFFTNPPQNDLKNPVSFVDLSRQKLTGIPPNVFRFEQLQTLLVQNNQIIRLSSAIGNLSKLEILNLSKNKLKTLPEDIGKLSYLRILDISRNQLTALPENMGDLQRLDSLNLSNNSLTNLPTSLGNLSNLISLTLQDNKLMALPTEITFLTHLTHLDLSDNRLKTLPDGVGQWTQLKWLNLSDNKLKTLPSDFGNIANLTYLDLSINALSSFEPEIGGLKNLDSLNMARNQLATLPTEIGNLSQLTVLDLNHNSLYKLPLEIGNLTNLTSLDLSSNLLSELPKEVKKLVNLKTLDLRFNQLTKEEIDKIKEWLPDCFIDF